MDRSSILAGMGIGICSFAVTTAVARHFTGLDQEHGLALVIGIVVGLVVGVGYVALESRLFDFRRRDDHR